MVGSCAYRQAAAGSDQRSGGNRGVGYNVDEEQETTLYHVGEREY